ncbi:MAG: hypothetical protein JO366_07600 [Methylobacteriaceae bacterium]|nr:hypothetical protein [Methylobacteriaceae bacterium]MBV9244660.1 hypothetical protein [Methylobacteriaceae bacterium]
MADQTVTGLFDTPDQAHRAVTELEAAGIPHSQISIMSNNADESWSNVSPAEEGRTSAAGAVGSIGALAGGGAGLLAGLGLLAIPGLGPVVAAGWLAAAAVGALAGGIAGGLIGALVDAGVSPEHAHVYAEGVRRGGSLVAARVDDALASKARSIMATNGAVDPETRRTVYEAGGWKGFDDAAPTYTREEVEAERNRHEL